MNSEADCGARDLQPLVGGVTMATSFGPGRERGGAPGSALDDVAQIPPRSWMRRNEVALGRSRPIVGAVIHGALLMNYTGPLAIALHERATQLHSEVRALVALGQKHNRALSPNESERLNILVEQAQGLDREARDAQEAYERSQISDRAAVEHGEIRGTERVGLGGWHTSSRDTYTAERSASGERSFFQDLLNAQVNNDMQAQQRMQAFQSEARAASTASFTGLIVPQYLVEQAALVQRQGRPFANSITRLQIPEQGTQFQIPRGTTGASVASQSGENTSVSSTDEVWANLTLNVVTIAGQQDVSRQSLERGTPGLDSLIYMDLAGAYAAELDRQCLNGSGASGQLLGTLGTSGIGAASAYGSALSPSKFQSKIAGTTSTITGARFLPPDTVAMHPRRWAWLLSQSDGQGRPLVVPQASGPVNAVGLGGPDAFGHNGAKYLGMDVVEDAQIPTTVGTLNEDVVITYRSADVMLWEDGDGMPQ